MAYYTLLEMVNGYWAPQFGDYDKATVAVERDDMSNRHCRPKRAYRIIRTLTASRTDIDAAIAPLNAELIPSLDTLTTEICDAAERADCRERQYPGRCPGTYATAYGTLSAIVDHLLSHGMVTDAGKLYLANQLVAVRHR